MSTGKSLHTTKGKKRSVKFVLVGTNVYRQIGGRNIQQLERRRALLEHNRTRAHWYEHL